MNHPTNAWRSIFEIYRSNDAEAAEIRGRHVAAVVRLTPFMMAVNLINASLVLAAFGGVAAGTSLWAWAALLAAVASLSVHRWWRQRDRAPGVASPRAVRRATLHAAVLALIWAAVPLGWFADASAAQQLLVATLTTGMLSAGALALSPLPAASLVYIGVLTLASIGALWRAGDALYLLVGFLMVCYSAAVAAAVLSSARQATALLRSERTAARQGRMVQLLLHDFEDHAAEAFWEADLAGHLTHISARLSELLGVAAPQLERHALLPMLEARSPQAAASLRGALSSGRPFRDLRLLVDEGDGARWWSLGAKPMVDEAGHASGWRGVLADITAEMQARERLQHLAHHDLLTGLANRVTLHEALGASLQAQRPGVMMVIDLDHFKAVNDSMGHAAGDELLRRVAQRLRDCVSDGDLVVRLGGDEFALLAFSAPTEGAAGAIAERVAQALATPCEVAGRRVTVGASIGMAMLPGSVHDGGSVDELMGRADLALYDAKEGGRGRHTMFTAQIGERGRRRAALAQALREAVGLSQLALHWQPKVNLADGSLCGAEALLRWLHPGFGQVEPAEFIGVAERAGLLDEIGGWALNEACRQAVTQLRGLTISVNVSPSQLRQPGYPALVAASLAASGLAATRLELEVTESVFIDDEAGALASMRALRGLGVRIALDDFGTGYSALAYLRRFRFDTLKIDRSFVAELRAPGDARAIVRMIVQLARTLGIRTVAEGVENTDQLAVLAEAGCEQVQGCVVAAAMPLAELVALRERWADRVDPATAVVAPPH